ncbi:hypothetical protein M8C21_002449 [Ambrosia artemisiifolia]|uniref:Uncharacterized protein n=1 Tax=Ambrosia artemisiifolia TaxID=4212 RepID=A0AAD5CDF4_AMBAR|nr:hypothetical protein M8C21_002449 [Ambrosia artemisiifolia]
MHDLILPPSKDHLSKVTTADLLPNPHEYATHKTPITSIKDDSININPVHIKGISDNNSNSDNGGSSKDWSAMSSLNCDISDDNEANDDLIAIEVSNVICADTCEDSELEYATSSTLNRPSIDGDVPRIERSLACNPDLEDETECLRMMKPIGHESERFEETCVLVDGDDYVLNELKEEIRSSFKNKIQKAFYLKRRSSRTLEYKQLDAQYKKVIAQQNVICEEAISHAVAISNNVKEKKSTMESIESEWELL